jgi:hypothetical protein
MKKTFVRFVRLQTVSKTIVLPHAKHHRLTAIISKPAMPRHRCLGGSGFSSVSAPL